MKRRIALILAILMLVGSIFSVLSFAEGEAAPEVTPEAESYTDVKIAYANLNYNDKICMKFAVPAYADLPEGAKIELILWESYEDGTTFGYGETVADETTVATASLLAPQADKATIGGKEYLVFIYDALTAEKMTDVIYTRPVVTLADGKLVYGDVINYSILEYVVTAQGGFEGVPAIADQEHLAVLDAMLDFGALAQTYLGDGGAYLPGGFYANDEVQKIWITPVMDGIPGEKIFGGFLKAGADFASVYPPVNDLCVVNSIVDAAGEALVDEDIDLSGIQIPAPESGDLEITMNLGRKTVFDTTIENGHLQKYTEDHTGTDIFTQTAAGRRVEMPEINACGNSGSGPAQGKNNFTSFTVMADPINPESGDKVLRWTGVENSALYFHPSNGKIYVRNIAGIGDTVAPVVTIEVTIAKYMEGPASSAHFRLRSDYLKAATGTGTAQCNLNVFKLSKGTVQLNTSDSTYVELCTLSADAYTTFAIVIDFAAETEKAYVMDENGEYQLVVEEFKRTRPAALAKGAAIVDESGNPRNVGYDNLYNWVMNAQHRVEWYGGNVSGGISNDQLATLKVDMDGDGTPETNISADGTLATINQEAYAMWFEQNRSILVKDVRMYAGDID